MANANLAIFLDGNGHVITRDAGEMFALPPLLRSIVEQLTGADFVPATNIVEEEARENLREVPASETEVGAVAAAEGSSKQPSAFALVNLAPWRFFLGVIPTNTISAVMGKCPGKFEISFFLKKKKNFQSPLANRNMRCLCFVRA